MTMTPERLAELDAVMAKATAGEWQADGLDIKLADAKKASWGKNEANNVAAIVALHNAYPDLRAHIEAQAATIARLREALLKFGGHKYPCGMNTTINGMSTVRAKCDCGYDQAFEPTTAALTGAA